MVMITPDAGRLAVETRDLGRPSSCLCSALSSLRMADQSVIVTSLISSACSLREGLLPDCGVMCREEREACTKVASFGEVMMVVRTEDGSRGEGVLQF